MITGIQTPQVDPLQWTQFDNRAPMAGAGATGQTPQRDSVSIQNPALLTDTEARDVLAAGQQMMQEKPGEAMALHQGLEYDRVMSLLADI